MRKFVVSDLHGNGDVYDSIMGYLDNLHLKEPVELTIAGDLVDYGFDSFRILLDVYERIQKGEGPKIHYLGGNHELMMYQALKARKPGKWIDHWSDWMCSGGWFVEGELDSREDGIELCNRFQEFISHLKIYQTFSETVAGKPIVVVHAQVPERIQELKNLTIGDDNQEVFDAVWTRREEREILFFEYGKIIGLNRVGLDGYFTINGHSANQNEYGFSYDVDENALNIDGACCSYALGKFQYNQVPLVEIKGDHIDILMFNHNNEITKGYHFDGLFSLMKPEELIVHREALNPQFNGQEKVYQKEITEIVKAE